MLDERLLRVSIFLEGEKEPHKFENLAIIATGTKYGSAISNVAEVRIANIEKKLRDKLVTEGSPYGRITRPRRNSILIEAGRKSSGLTQIYIGDITTVGITQAPDIWLVMRTVTGQFLKKETVIISRPPLTKFSAISGQVASILDLSLDFQAQDKNVKNFSFSDSAGKLIGKLSDITYGVDAYVDDDRLTVRPRFKVDSPNVTEININTGLIGIPEVVGLGIRCTVLLDQEIRLGDKINLTSKAYPAVDGIYIIYQLSFNLATRDNPFYYIFEGYNRDLGER